MAFALPSLDGLVARVKGDLTSRIASPLALVRGSLPWACAHMLASVAWGLYQHQAWIARQILPDTADPEVLLRWAELYGLTLTPADTAAGAVEVTAIAGSTLSSGALYQRADGVQYAVTGGPYVWETASAQEVTLEAETAGEAGNYPYVSGAVLTLVSPPAGVVSEAPLVSPGISGGTDIESTDSLLARLLSRLQSPPQGGSRADYIAWAEAALSDVARVWVFGVADGLPAGEVRVYCTVAAEGADVLPTAGDLATITDYIEARRPVTAAVTVAAPVEHALTLTIGLTAEVGADIDAVRAAVTAELRSMLADRTELACSEQALPNSYLRDAIGAADGVDHYTLESVDGGAGTDDVTLAAYAYPTLVEGGITWS